MFWGRKFAEGPPQPVSLILHYFSEEENVKESRKKRLSRRMTGDEEYLFFYR